MMSVKFALFVIAVSVVQAYAYRETCPDGFLHTPDGECELDPSQFMLDRSGSPGVQVKGAFEVLGCPTGTTRVNNLCVTRH
ncbi:unnamed protein product [Colias eurytheme]|nr:unnamed protein product [Colias eurytheme]